MSFEAMTWAVKQDLPVKQKMVLLMLSNRCNADTGRCDPSHQRLARDCGMSVSSVKRAINELAEMKLLAIEHRRMGDVSLPNQYLLNLNQVGSHGTGGWVQPDLEVGSGRPTKQESNQEDKHSCDQQAESRKAVEKIPYDEIFDAYAEKLPELPQLRIKDDARRKAIKSMWRSDDRFQSADFWSRYYGFVKESPFLMAMNGIGFDWLMKPANFKKVLEGNYHNKEQQYA